MKKNSFLAILFFGAVFCLQAQSIDQPLVKIEYDFIDIITEKMVSARMNQNKTTLKMMGQDDSLLTREMVIESLVKEKLLLQGAKSQKVEVDDYSVSTYVNSELKKQREMLDKRMGRKLTDDEFNQFLKGAGIQVQDFKDNYKRMQTIKQYVEKERANEIKNFPKPTEANAKKLFDSYLAKGQLTKPVFVKIGHIYFSTKGKSFSDMKSIHTKAETVRKEIASGKRTFAQAVKTESEDPQSKEKGGLLGWTGLIDPALISLFGEERATDIVALKKGTLSEVLESDSGFHIVYVFDREEGGIPRFTDQRFPESNVTFKDYFMEMLKQSSAEQAFGEAMESLFQELKKEATITYYNKESKEQKKK